MTLEEAQAKLLLWQTAEDTVASGGQSYTIGKVSYTAANLSEIRLMISKYEAVINQISTGRRQGARQLRAVPRDY